MSHADIHMRAIRVTGIAIACAVHGALLLESPLSQAVDLSSGAINASQFSLSINYQSALASNDSSPITEEILPAKQTPTVAAAKPETAAKTANESNQSHHAPIKKTVAEVNPRKPAEPVEQKANQKQLVQQPVNKPDQTFVTQQQPVEPEEQVVEEIAVAIAKAPEQSPVEGLHKAVIAKPLFAAPPEPPSYPKLARKRGQQGTVWVEVLLGETGQQIRAEVYQSSGASLLDRAALSVVKKWQFIAHRINGVAVASRIRIPVEFSLD